MSSRDTCVSMFCYRFHWLGEMSVKRGQYRLSSAQFSILASVVVDIEESGREVM